MKKTKTKLWKKIMVGIMSFTMFAGNLSSMSMEVFAAEMDGFEEFAEEEGYAEESADVTPEAEAVADEYVPEYVEEDIPAEVAYYTVSYYDAAGEYIGSSEFAEGSGLSFPYIDGYVYWTDESGTEYTSGDAVYSDLSLFAVVDDTYTEDSEDEAEEDAYIFSIDVQIVDEDGLLIAGYEDYGLPTFGSTLDLTRAPFEIAGYEYVDATIDGETALALTKEEGAYSYETDSAVVDIETDTIISFNYKEEAAVSTLVATVVDEFGDEISEEYTNMEITGFDESGILVLDDPELPPVEEVKVKTGIIRSVKYEYVKAVLNNKMITALKTEETADGNLYFYTTDGEKWYAVKGDAVVLFQYTDGRKTVYTYEDDDVKVTATLQHANAVPDDAYFAVTPITDGGDYDVDAYLDALNDRADMPEDFEDFEYSRSNTLLYDIAFYTDETMTEEIEPADGMVKTEIEFKNNQLEDELDASERSEILVNHLSVDDAVIEEAGTTANADVKAADIAVETLDADVTVSGEAVAFTTEGYSVFTITSPYMKKRVIFKFYDMNGKLVADPTVPSEAYLYVYRVNNPNEHTLVRLSDATLKEDGRLVYACYPGTNAEAKQNLFSDSLTKFYDKSTDPNGYGVEIWALKSGANASSINKNTVFDDGKFTKVTTDSETPGVIGEYTFTIPEDKLLSTDSDYLITATRSSFATGPIYLDVLGDAVYYGIVANEYKTTADTQTNFAVKKFTSSGNAAGSNLSNNPGDIYVGEITDSLKIRSEITAPSNVFVGTDGDARKVTDNSNKAKITVMGRNEINTKVDSMIRNIHVPSATSYINVSGSDANNYVIDTTSYPDNAVLHVNLDQAKLYEAFGNTGGVHIKKKADQTIVFHSAKNDVRIAKFMLWDPAANKYTDSVSATSVGAQNNTLAPYAETLIFDFSSSKKVEFTGGVTGIFLAPNADVKWGTACCGWLICKKAEASGEWHNIYQEMPKSDVEDDETSIDLYITKHLYYSDTTTPADEWPENGFKFKIEKYWGDIPGDKNRGQLQDTLNRTGNNYNLSNLSDDATWNGRDGYMIVTIPKEYADQPLLVGSTDLFTGKYVWEKGADYAGHKYLTYMYKITELGPDPANEQYTYMREPLFVKFFVNCEKTSDRYYVSVEGPKVCEGVTEGYECELKPVEFTNYYTPVRETGSIEITKRLVGKDSADNIVYRFKLFGQNETRNPVGDLRAKLEFTSSKGRTVAYETKYEKINNDPNTREVFYFDLYADETVTISGLPVVDRDPASERNEYYVQEVNGQSDADQVYVEEPINFIPDTANPPQFALSQRTYNFSESPYASLTYVNVYYSNLVIEKSIVGYENLTDEQKQNITFTVTGPSYPDGFTVTYDQFTDGKYEFTGLLQGEYTVVESGQNIDNEYICETTYSNGGKAVIKPGQDGKITVTNTYTHNVVDISGTKTWDDASDQDGLRPDKITLKLYQNYTEGAAPYDTIEVLKPEGDPVDVWNWSFTGLPKYDAEGHLYTYTVKEDVVAHYTTAPADGIQISLTSDTVSVSELNITNSYTPETTEIEVKKIWEGDTDNTEFRKEITVYLLKNGVKTDKTVTLKSSNNWTAKFENLDVKENGQAITYDVEEVEVEHYKSVKTGSASTGFIFTNTFDREYVKVRGEKIWDDRDNWDGSRPATIMITLSRETPSLGKKTVKTKPVTGSADSNKWEWNFDELTLDKYLGGELVTYTVTEAEVTGYSTRILDPVVTEVTEDDVTYKQFFFTIENKYTPTTKEVSGSKTWNDENDQDGMRPTEIRVTLWKQVGNGALESVGTKVVTAADGWAWKWTDLKAKENNVPVTYSITEQAVLGYTTSIEGYNIINTHVPEKIWINGTKEWDDNDDQDGIRPASVLIGLFKGSEKIAETTATAADGWSWSFGGSATEGLAKYENKHLINYTVKELGTYTGYKITTPEADENGEHVLTVVNGKDTKVVSGLKFENKHIPVTVNIEVQKVWDDNDDQDGVRPDSVTVVLLGDGVKVGSATLSQANDWKAFFYDLPKKVNENGVSRNIDYSIQELTVPEYAVSVSGPDEAANIYKAVVTNTHTPEVTEVNGAKTWNDNDDQDGARPVSITINLLADGEKIASKTVTKDDDWKWSFTGLDKKSGGKDIEYTITEDVVTGYTTVVSGHDVINTHVPEKIDIKGIKTWDDNDDQDGMRPASLTVTLYRGEKQIGQQVTTANDGWAWAFTGLDKLDKGQPIEYTIKESYELKNGGTYTLVEVLKNGTGVTATADSVTVSSADAQAVAGAPEGTNPVINVEFINKHTPELIRIEGEKVWYDNDNQDGKRPVDDNKVQFINVKLFENGTEIAQKAVKVTENGDWKWTWADLPKYKDGAVINYTVLEVLSGDAASLYTATYEQPKASKNDPTVYQVKITNTYSPEKLNIIGTKVWNDNNDQDGTRKNIEKITVKLYADGVYKASAFSYPSADGSTWSTWEFKNLDRYKSGKEIIYTVTEDPVPESYTAKVEKISEETVKDQVYVITNKHTPELIDISGSKDWDDNDNQDGVRPSSITFTLTASNVKDFEAQTCTTNASKNWEWAFTKLPKYNNGVEVEYNVTEQINLDSGYVLDSVSKEAPYKAGNNTEIVFTNKYTPEKTSIEGVKHWDDNRDQDGMRPAKVVIQLYADGTKIDSQTITVDNANNAGDWAWKFEDLDKYRDGGIEILYTVTEDVTQLKADLVDSVNGKYTAENNGNAINKDGVLTITNTHKPLETSISGHKVWVDNNNQDGKRPQKLTVVLNRKVGDDASFTEVTRKDITGTGNTWSWSFDKLPVYEAGKKISYYVVEIPVNDYKRSDDLKNVRALPGLENITEGYPDSEGSGTATVEGVEFVNYHIPETITLNGTKTWEDDANRDGKRPVSITLGLYKKTSAEAEPVRVKTFTVTGDRTAKSWNWELTDLDKYEDGKLIMYSVQEESRITGYDTEVKDGGKNIINTYKPETVTISGYKTWDDSNNQDGARTKSVTINLFADGEKIDSRTIAPAEEDLSKPEAWNYEFKNLPKYRTGKVGEEIVYSITEDAVKDYTTTYDGNNVINKHNPGKVNISGIKVWKDDENRDGLRPGQITVNLLADGTKVDSVIAYEKDDYAWEFLNLDQFKAGKAIVYTVTEEPVEGYDTKIELLDNGKFQITNTHIPAKIKVVGEKTWNDDSDRDGVRPKYITIHLMANGKEAASAKVEANEGKWAYEFNDLNKFDNGKEIEYTITEDEIKDNNGKPLYNATITKSELKDEETGTVTVGYTINIENKHTPELTTVSGDKHWIDDDDRDGLRPDSLTVYLKANDTQVDTATVTAADNWHYEFKNLPKNDKGVEIKYSVDEAQIDNYIKSFGNGYDLINTHKPETVDISGEKKWVDTDFQKIVRPVSIQIQLLADGQPILKDGVTDPATIKVVTATDNWKWEFKGLPKYKNNGTNGGVVINYSVKETEIEGYDTTYGGDNYSHIVTNTGETEYTGLQIVKKWFGTDAKATVDSIKVTVEGRVNGQVVVPAIEKTVSASKNWTEVITKDSKELPKYYKGQEITYYITEAASENGKYIQIDANGAEMNDPVIATAAEGEGLEATLTNMGLIDIPVEKKWLLDSQTADPAYFANVESINIVLKADGKEVRQATIRKSENWKYTFTGLKQFNPDGTAIKYDVEETTVLKNYKIPRIEEKNGGFVITNEIDPMKLQLTKVWTDDDEEGEEPKNHPAIQIRVFSSVPTKENVSSVTDRIKKMLGLDSDKWYEYTVVTLDGVVDSIETKPWYAEINNLPRVVINGTTPVEVSYAVQEVEAPEGYTSVTNVDGDQATVINFPKTSVAGFKTWDDGSNVVGYRPGSDEFAELIVLYQDGKQFLTGKDKDHFKWIDTTGDSWSFEFFDLPSVSADGKHEYKYTIGELARVLGYGEPTIDGYTIKNPLEFTEISVVKIWDDQDNVYATRPSTIAFRLLANGAQANISGVTSVVTLDNQNRASYTWKNLPVCDRNGNKIAYTVEEVSVPAGYTASANVNGTTTTITNRFRPEETQITVYKVWDDLNDAARRRPTSIQVALTRNGVDVETVTLSASNGWTHTWTGLPTILADGTGTKATYGVREVSQILGYTVNVTGSGTSYTITNYYREPETPPETPPSTPPTTPPTTPPEQPPYTIPDEPTPLAGLSEVLGARRTPNGSVLGARRSPQTGDASQAASFAAAMASAGAMMGAWFAMRKRKKG